MHKRKRRKVRLSEKDRKRIRKNHREEFKNKENDWDRVTAANMIYGPIKNVTPKEIIKVMKPGKAAGPSKVCAEIIIASGEIGVSVMLKLCQRVLDGKGRRDEWQTSVLVPIFKEKGYVRNCNNYRGVKLLEHVMIVEKVC